ncbi:hypothetical protein HNP32_001732 [Brevundimonas bullata]|uniref:Uncharacterized protein n=1 Tax=Brevundimonas bullata TaxID=13160 RepID=A0A7W7IP92_9CAUL|nr:hypothetical protein [Brevundimonas bullata]MBB4798008.1 hypothetical protein [Brevundimonas bullata]MBB6382967.1 hypothetical protein [Brevundimonas bullata]
MSDTRIKITAGGIHDGEGKEIPVGTELTVQGEPTAWAGRYETISAGEKPGKTPVTNPKAGEKPGNDQPPAEFVPPVGPFTAKEKSPGWWSIFDGADQPVGKSVRKNDLDGFDSLSDDDKLAFATESAKAAFDKAAA